MAALWALKAGADPNWNMYMKAPLDSAVSAVYIVLFDFLLRGGVDLTWPGTTEKSESRYLRVYALYARKTWFPSRCG
jgi:hypothetical protein